MLAKQKAGASRPLPEVFSTVDAGEDAAGSANVHVLVDLSFFKGFAATITGEEDHFNHKSVLIDYPGKISVQTRVHNMQRKRVNPNLFNPRANARANRTQFEVTLIE